MSIMLIADLLFGLCTVARSLLLQQRTILRTEDTTGVHLKLHLWAPASGVIMADDHFRSACILAHLALL
jgi:hypothetical protein